MGNVVQQGCAVSSAHDKLCGVYGNSQTSTGCKESGAGMVIQCSKTDFGKYSGSPAAMRSMLKKAPACRKGAARPPPPPAAKYVNFVLSLKGLKAKLLTAVAKTKVQELFLSLVGKICGMGGTAACTKDDVSLGIRELDWSKR